ncbi:hypothetical protein Bca52824_004109 [Brassica carinata]|uniref:Uncharacterized protein n=1 Tax=Brassica carinata TaxID=52824 RepID=A0A8X7WNI2_BRACI|nr:hypothetical protein Bca52824_004109 [Brassica carinata]
MPCTLKRISAVRFASAHEDEYSNRLWSVHHIWVPALLLSVFRSRPSSKLVILSVHSLPRRTLTYDKPLGTSQSLYSFLVNSVIFGAVITVLVSHP